MFADRLSRRRSPGPQMSSEAGRRKVVIRSLRRGARGRTALRHADQRGLFANGPAAGSLVHRFDREDGMRKAVQNVGSGVCSLRLEISHHRDEAARARNRRHGAIRRRCLRVHHHHQAAAGGGSHGLVVGDAR